MTMHLSDAERIDALEGTLSARRQQHLDGCAECRQVVTELERVWTDVAAAAADDVPEPSPLFWDHFQRRVGEAVDLVPPAAPVAWWRGSASAWFALATAAAVVLMATVTSPRWQARTSQSEMAEVVALNEPDTEEQARLQFMTDVLSTFEHEAVREVLAPSTNAVDAAFGALTASEREAVFKLLQAELLEGSEE